MAKQPAKKPRATKPRAPAKPAAAAKQPAAKAPAASSEGHITLGQASRLLMISEERLRQLIKQGYVSRPAPGRTTLVSAVQGYIRFLKEEDRRGTKSAASNRVRDARAEEIEIRIAEKRRQLIPIEDAVAALDMVVSAVKEEFMGLAARVTRDMVLRRKVETEVNASQKRVAEALTTFTEFAKEGGELPNSSADHDA